MRVFALCCLFLAVASLGCGSFCNPLSGTSVQVRIKGAMPLPVPCPVTLEDQAIGRVASMETDDQGYTVLDVCLRDEHLEKLKGLTVFYADKDAPAAGLVCVPIEHSGPLPPDLRSFVGFASHGEYAAWRTNELIRKGVDELLKGLDQALGQ